MDKFLSGYKRKVDNNEDNDADTSGNKSKKEGGKAPKKRQYSSSYLSLGFTSAIIDGLGKPMCLLCSKVLASDSMRPVKLSVVFFGLVLYLSNDFIGLDFSKVLWIQNPFIDNEDEFQLTTIKKENLIELSCNSSLKQKFQNETIIQFWVNLSGEYRYLYCKAIQVLLPLVTSYLCKTGFSALAATKTKYQTRLTVEKELRVALSTLPPRYDKLCANKQQ